MAYKRLTEIRNGEVIDNCKNCPNIKNPQGCTEKVCNEIKKNRLAELEDKIKNGLLVERPCKVGDKFYEIIPGLLPREWIVDEFVEGKESVVIFGRLNTGKGGYWKFWIDDFGKTIFTTKEAAEAKLEELRGRNDIRNNISNNTFVDRCSCLLFCKKSGQRAIQKN